MTRLHATAVTLTHSHIHFNESSLTSAHIPPPDTHAMSDDSGEKNTQSNETNGANQQVETANSSSSSLPSPPTAIASSSSSSSLSLHPSSHSPTHHRSRSPRRRDDRRHSTHQHTHMQTQQQYEEVHYQQPMQLQIHQQQQQQQQQPQYSPSPLPLPSSHSRPIPSPSYHLPPRRRVLVTGGSGFLGRHLIQTLLGLGHVIRCFDLVQSFTDARVEFFVGDLSTDQAELNAACADVDTVFHTASLTDASATLQAIWQVNVTGTRNVIRACLTAGVKNLIFTSTTAVVFNGRDMNGLTEAQCSYPRRYFDPYCQSKAEAEKMVVAANGQISPLTGQALCTVSLRPHAIFGPRDIHFISKLISRGRNGDITHMIGSGNNQVDFTYVGNVIHAMCITMNQLSDPTIDPSAIQPAEYIAARQRIGGQCYFITNNEPRPFWEFINTILNETGCVGPTKKISFSIAYFIAWLMEWLRWFISLTPILSRYYQMEPSITRHMVCIMGCTQWYSIEKAQRELGYQPIISLDQGLETTINYIFRNSKNHNHKLRQITPHTNANAACAQPSPHQHAAHTNDAHAQHSLPTSSSHSPSPSQLHQSSHPLPSSYSSPHVSSAALPLNSLIPAPKHTSRIHSVPNEGVDLHPPPHPSHSTQRRSVSPHGSHGSHATAATSVHALSHPSHAAAAWRRHSFVQEHNHVIPSPYQTNHQSHANTHTHTQHNHTNHTHHQPSSSQHTYHNTSAAAPYLHSSATPSGTHSSSHSPHSKTSHLSSASSSSSSSVHPQWSSSSSHRPPHTFTYTPLPFQVSPHPLNGAGDCPPLLTPGAHHYSPPPSSSPLPLSATASSTDMHHSHNDAIHPPPPPPSSSHSVRSLLPSVPSAMFLNAYGNQSSSLYQPHSLSGGAVASNHSAHNTPLNTARTIRRHKQQQQEQETNRGTMTTEAEARQEDETRPSNCKEQVQQE